MSDVVVQSKEGDSHTLHNLSEFAFAREVVKDHPRVIRVYEKLLPVLYAFAQYQGVWLVIQAVEDSKLLLEMQYTFYKRIYDKKGLVEKPK